MLSKKVAPGGATPQATFGYAAVVILGPGGSGKSTLAIHLGEITGLPVIELDKLFWRSGLAARRAMSG